MTRKNPISPDALKVFETLPAAYLILSPELYILNASDIYLKATLATRNEIIGKYVYEVFPDNPDSSDNNSAAQSKASLQKVLTTLKPHQIEFLRYDVPRPRETGGGFEKKYWNIINTPVLDEQGSIHYIIHNVIDVTEQVQSLQQVQELTEREKAALNEVEWQNKRLNEFLLQAPSAIGIYLGKDFIIELVNPLMSEIVGRPSEELLGIPLFEALPELKGQGFEPILSEVYITGKTIDLPEVPVVIKRKGELVAGFYHTIYQALKNRHGEIVGVINIATEISEQVKNRKNVEKSERQLRLITDAMPVLIGYLDKEEKYRFANRAYKTWFNQNPEELLDRPVREVIGEKAYQGVKVYIDRALSGERLDFDARMPYREDFIKHIRTSYVPDFQEGKVVGFYTLINDITDRVEAQKKVEESEKRFRNLLESIPQMTWTNLPDGNVNFYSQPWYEYTGLTYELLKNLGFQSIVHPDDLGEMMDIYLKAMKDGETFVHENRLKQHDGTYRWHLNRSVPMKDESGEATLWVGTSTDIHEKKILEQKLIESEQYFRMMADHVPVMIWVTQPDGYCNYLNKQWYDFTGQAKEEALGLGWLKAVHPDDSQMAGDVFLHANANHIPFKYTYRLRRKDGEYRWAIDIGVPKFSDEGEFEGFVGVVTDIHERKMAEEALHQISQELAATNEELRAANEEIQANNEDLAQTNQQLSYINADMDNFIYTASHDLRAPISNIEGLMAALLKNLSEDSRASPMTAKISGMITQSIERFKKTLADLTQITRVQRDGIGEDQSQIDLTEVISEVRLDLAPQIEQANAQIDMSFDHCKVLHFSAKNIRSIVYNLLSNAIKYRSTLRQTIIRINCYDEGDYLVLSVEDNGLGMDLNDESKIFAMFKRLHDHVEGTGVGLYIVKKIIENAGGKIKVQSKPDQGTTFKVYFKQSNMNK